MAPNQATHNTMRDVESDTRVLQDLLDSLEVDIVNRPFNRWLSLCSLEQLFFLGRAASDDFHPKLIEWAKIARVLMIAEGVSADNRNPEEVRRHIKILGHCALIEYAVAREWVEVTAPIRLASKPVPEIHATPIGLMLRKVMGRKSAFAQIIPNRLSNKRFG